MLSVADVVSWGCLSADDLPLAEPRDDVRGLAVVDAEGLRLGVVDDLVVDHDARRARLLIVLSGGVVGLAPRRHLVPVEAVTKVDDRVWIDHRPRPSGSAAPGRTKPGGPSGDDVAEAYRGHGVPPFWEAADVGAASYFHQR